MTLGRLKWLAIVGPVGVLVLAWVLLHTWLEALHDFPQVLALFGFVALAVWGFSFGVFNLVERLERRIVEQNAELERRNRELAALLSVGRAASSSLDVGAVVDAALDATLEAVGADAIELWLATDGELEPVGRRGPSLSAPPADGEDERDGHGGILDVADLAATSGAPVVAGALPDAATDLDRRMADRGLPSFCAVPLAHRGESLGVLAVAAHAPGRLCSDREIRLLEGVGEHVASAVAIARLHERVLDGAVIDERLRLARGLHDGLAQVLGYINTQTLAVRKLLRSGRVDDAQQELEAMQEAARSVSGDIREAILELRVALPRGGLVAGIERYLDGYRAMAGADVRLELRGHVEELPLAPSAEIQAVRIVQEALHNARKHAHASRCRVLLAADGDELLVEVSDDGRGFLPGASQPSGWPRFGIQSMRERAEAVGGHFDLTSQPGRGTTVRVRIPTIREAADARTAG